MIDEAYRIRFSPLNLFENEKEVYDFCQISDNIQHLQDFRKACFDYGGLSFIHIIDDRIEEIELK